MIEEIKKRGKGKITKCLGLREIYKFYLSNLKKDEDKLNYKEFSKIIKACNLETIRNITQESETFSVPYRCGQLRVIKYDRVYNNKKKWAIDFKATKEKGFTVYFDQPYIYKFTWVKKNAIVKNKGKYKFIPTRMAKREIPRMLKTKKIDYYS